MSLTGSALPRAFACPGSLALPQARTSSEWSDLGDDRHEEQEDAIIKGDLSKLPDRLRALIPEGATVRAEVAVAYDIATGTARELGAGIGRAYGKMGPFEVPGQIDLLVTAPGFLLVADHKGFEDVDDPERNEQTLFYTLAASRIWPAENIVSAIAYLPTGFVKHAKLDVLDLDAFAERLTQLLLDIAAERARPVPHVSESKHCRYCPAAHVCPVKVALIHRLVSGEESEQLERMMPLDEETAALAYERLGHARNLLKRIERAIYAYAAEKPVRLRNGNVLGYHKKVGNRKLDGDVVFNVLREKYSREVADAAVIRSATQVRIKEALANAGVATPEKAKDAVIALVDAMGGVTRETEDKLEEHRPQLKAAANQG